MTVYVRLTEMSKIPCEFCESPSYSQSWRQQWYGHGLHTAPGMWLCLQKPAEICCSSAGQQHACPPTPETPRQSAEILGRFSLTGSLSLSSGHRFSSGVRQRRAKTDRSEIRIISSSELFVHGGSATIVAKFAVPHHGHGQILPPATAFGTITPERGPLPDLNGIRAPGAECGLTLSA